MNREIKFRARADGLRKSKPHKMLYMKDNDFIYADFDGHLEERPLNALFGNCNNHVWMQYTGLKDKNGKEIYEGDIVTIYGHLPQFPIETGTVEWIHTDSSFGVYWEREDFPTALPYGTSITVIGNKV